MKTVRLFMLDSKLVYNNFDYVFEKLSRRGFILDNNKLIKKNNLRKTLQKQIESIYIRKKNISKNFNVIKNQGADITSLLNESHSLNHDLMLIKKKIKILQQEIKQYQLSFPNIPCENIPDGYKEENNLEIMRWGDIHHCNVNPIDHLELGKLTGEIDLISASKITGSRFIILKGKIARLHRALSQFMVDIHVKYHGYEEYYLPYLVNISSLYGSGQLPKFHKDLFHIKLNNVDMLHQSKMSVYSLIPTAEVPLINLMRNVTVEENELPIKMVSHTPCFRSEAGTYGCRSHGLIRAHQFDKVELVQIVHPDQSKRALEEITNHAEKILQLLELPYRKMLLCAGNMSFAACKTYDLEVWLPTRNAYCEISSCSNINDFQARRIKACFINKTNNKKFFVHTLNASGVAVGRTLVAILENYQLKDNRCIKIPKVLYPYMNGITHIYY